jgi:hypothetical protein
VREELYIASSSSRTSLAILGSACMARVAALVVYIYIYIYIQIAGPAHAGKRNVDGAIIIAGRNVL